MLLLRLVKIADSNIEWFNLIYKDCRQAHAVFTLLCLLAASH